jgi:aminopeptidase N
MLRGVVGTDVFWKGIREYYARYRNGNASTDDFRRVMEEASAKDLAGFFRQWLYRGGYPVLAGTWRYDAAAGGIVVDLAQTQPGDPFRMPLEIGLRVKGALRVERVEMTGAKQSFTIKADAEPESVVLDPGTWLLHEGALTKG